RVAAALISAKFPAVPFVSGSAFEVQDSEPTAGGRRASSQRDGEGDKAGCLRPVLILRAMMIGDVFVENI
ncbi:MAG: hypothetical protein ACKVHE_37050, partial [Planctomycetales bacterium]